MRKRLMLISTSNFTANPRLLKEYLYYSKHHDVEVVKFDLAGWYSEIEKDVIQKHGIVNIHPVLAPSKFTMAWFALQLKYVIYRMLERINPTVKHMAFSSNKLSILLDQKLRQLEGNYDGVLAHTLGALYPAYNFCKRHHIKMVFDVEDYHPGERITTSDVKREIGRREKLMCSLMPELTAYTCASPLIGSEVEKLIGPGKVESIYISNSFRRDEFTFNGRDEFTFNGQDNTGKQLKAVWFSQNISYNRGLEGILKLMPAFRDRLSLTLIGNVNQEFYQEYIQGLDNVIVEAPLEQSELHLKLGSFDIGLALEQRQADLNRNLCLTNKIFAYYQAGLFILATDTEAQKQFMDQHKDIGMMIPEMADQFEKLLSDVIDQKEEIRKNKEKRFQQAREDAWESQHEKYDKVVRKL